MTNVTASVGELVSVPALADGKLVRPWDWPTCAVDVGDRVSDAIAPEIFGFFRANGVNLKRYRNVRVNLTRHKSAEE